MRTSPRRRLPRHFQPPATSFSDARQRRPVPRQREGSAEREVCNHPANFILCGPLGQCQPNREPRDTALTRRRARAWSRSCAPAEPSQPVAQPRTVAGHTGSPDGHHQVSSIVGAPPGEPREKSQETFRRRACRPPGPCNAHNSYQVPVAAREANGGPCRSGSLAKNRGKCRALREKAWYVSTRSAGSFPPDRSQSRCRNSEPASPSSGCVVRGEMRVSRDFPGFSACNFDSTVSNHRD